MSQIIDVPKAQALGQVLREFSQPLLEWYTVYGRHGLPWQTNKTAYRVWISEIMLQQTQVQTVVPYYHRFMQRFPAIEDLGCANIDEVLSYWSGLGYYSRARNIHKTALIICHSYAGKFPETAEELVVLPGIGTSTAAAIASLAFNKKSAILDANVKRVLSRFFLIAGDPKSTKTLKEQWRLADLCMPERLCADYTQAIMDLGATVCLAKTPRCHVCPLQAHCQAFIQHSVDQYPAKSIKKAKPHRQEQFLLLYDAEKRIYLEKRPAKGIWGGLWSLPAVDMATDANAYLASHYGITGTKLRPLMQIKHSFTHFHLQIFVMAAAIDSSALPLQAPELAGKWFTPSEGLSLGISKPVRQIIGSFFSE